VSCVGCAAREDQDGKQEFLGAENNERAPNPSFEGEEVRALQGRIKTLVVGNRDSRLGQAELFRANVHGFDTSAVSGCFVGADGAHAVTADEQR
jgi:hypothetical protein